MLQLFLIAIRGGNLETGPLTGNDLAMLMSDAMLDRQFLAMLDGVANGTKVFVFHGVPFPDSKS